MVDLGLRNTVEVVLNRVFNRDDLDLRVAEFLETRVEGRRFSGAGRSGGQDESVRLADLVHHDLVEIFIHAELFQRYGD